MEDIKRFSEHFFCDSLRLAQLLADLYGAKVSEGIGRSEDFPLNPKEKAQVGDEIKFFSVDSPRQHFEVSFVSTDDPTPEWAMIRNKSYHRVLIGAVIRKKRRERGLSLQQLSDLTGFRAHSLERIEEGRWDMDVSQLGLILDALGCYVNLIDK